MNSEECLKKDITITREERLSISGKSLLFVISIQHIGISTIRELQALCIIGTSCKKRASGGTLTHRHIDTSALFLKKIKKISESKNKSVSLYLRK